MPSSVYVFEREPGSGLAPGAPVPDLLDPGEACRVRFDGDDIVTTCRRGEITAELIRDLNAAKLAIMDPGIWGVRPGAILPDRLLAAPADNPEAARAMYEIVTPDDKLLQPGRLCACYERPGLVLWLVAEGHMTELFRDQINEWLRIIVGGGLLLRQRPAE
jgi:hypothetical protein